MDCGKKQRQQNTNDGNHRQQLNKRKPEPTTRHAFLAS
jgi:hypothetical protein